MDVGLGKNNMKISKLKQFKVLVKGVCPICGKKRANHVENSLCEKILNINNKDNQKTV